ncbi:MAG: hypothetical protein IKF14_08315 [Atopobiaceae bacterium]|nr:hypothetical protein [Atopobiaceae bacterium]
MTEHDHGIGPDLNMCASHNRRVFDEVLRPYVATKLEQVLSSLPHGTQSGWLDASGCVWCLFDDESFLRSGDAGRRQRAKQGEGCDLQVYWSMGDVVMPSACDARWVAERIAEEAVRQLSDGGYRCTLEEREVEGETHLGVRFRKRLLHW